MDIDGNTLYEILFDLCINTFSLVLRQCGTYINIYGDGKSCTVDFVGILHESCIVKVINLKLIYNQQFLSIEIIFHN